MIPLEVTPEQLPAISAAIGEAESTLAALLKGAALPAAPVPTGPHMPGLLMSAGFGVVQSVLFSYLAAGVVEKLNGGETLVPVSANFESTDVAGGADVTVAGGLFAGGPR